MKKNMCPYLDSQNRCTHKLPVQKKKQPFCIYSNEFKCELHNEWFNKIKSLRMAKNKDEATIRKWLTEMKRRWNNE